MGGDALFVLLLIFTVMVIVTGIIYIRTGMKPVDGGERKLGYIRAGWLIIGIYSVLATAGLIFLGFKTSSFLVWLILLSPIIILLGLVLTLSFGIYYLSEGNKGIDGDKRKISIGVVCLVINAVIVLSIGTLLILFMNGVIPIRLM